MRSVVVTKFLPSPTGSGGQQRVFEVVRRLRALGPTRVCCFDDGSADPSLLSGLGVVARTAWQPRPASTITSSVSRGSLTTGRFWSAPVVATSAAVDGFRTGCGNESGVIIEDDLRQWPRLLHERADPNRNVVASRAASTLFDQHYSANVVMSRHDELSSPRARSDQLA